jgi:hypothetical protein
MSDIFEGYSPEFQDAYERRFRFRVDGIPIFNEWIQEFDDWINESRGSEWVLKDGMLVKDFLNPSMSQIKALGYNAKLKGLDTTIKMRVQDKRTKKGFREVYKDIFTGKFSKNPYKELEGKEE